MTVTGFTNPVITYIDMACQNLANGTLTANFTCSFPMKYYDDSQRYDINVTVRDISGVLAYNDTEFFNYNSLKAWTLTPTSFSFPSANPESTDIASIQNPIKMNNTGNEDISTINVTAYDLAGTTDPSYFIGAGNFSVNIINAASGDILSNATEIPVSGSSLPSGPLSVENLYFWLEYVPNVINQIYDTSTLGQWIIKGE